MSDEKTMIDEVRLYVDATLIDRENPGSRVYGVFGPFSDRGEAERCLTALGGRPDIETAVIRDPLKGRRP